MIAKPSLLIAWVSCNMAIRASTLCTYRPYNASFRSRGPSSRSLTVLHNLVQHGPLPSIPIIARHVILSIPILITTNLVIQEIVFLELFLSRSQVVDQDIHYIAKPLHV